MQLCTFLLMHIIWFCFDFWNTVYCNITRNTYHIHISSYYRGMCSSINRTMAVLVNVNSWLYSTTCIHYDDVIMGTIASQITSLPSVYSTVYSGADQSKHQSSASLAFVWGIHRGPVNSPHKGPVTRKMFPFDDVIMSIIFRHPRSGSGDYCWCVDGRWRWW